MEAAVDAQRRADDSLDHETPLSEVFEDQIACADIVLFNDTSPLPSLQEQVSLVARSFGL